VTAADTFAASWLGRFLGLAGPAIRPISQAAL